MRRCLESLESFESCWKSWKDLGILPNLSIVEKIDHEIAPLAPPVLNEIGCFVLGEASSF